MEKVNISLAGCGFLGIYHIGVASCFKEYAPHLLLNKISGASIGAIAGCCLLSDLPLGVFTSEMLQMISEVRSRPLGPFNPLTNIHNMLRNLMYKNLPKNAYKKVNGRLFISLTKVADGSNVIVSEFNSNEELFGALLASAFVPFFSGFIPPKFREYRYIDGGFSNNLPILDENTITVSPFCGESDICPRDITVQLFHINFMNTSIQFSKPNIDRFGRILFPPSAEDLSKMCKQGFDDALKFLQRNNLISCKKCLTVQRIISFPTMRSKDQINQNEVFDPECKQCIHHKEKAASSNLPESVKKIFENGIETANKELTGWILKHKGMKIVSVLITPSILTIDTISAVLKKFLEVAPEFVAAVSAYRNNLLQILINTLHKLHRTGMFLASKIFGPLSISVYIDRKGNIIRQSNDACINRTVSVEFKYNSEADVKLNENMFKENETLIVHPNDGSAICDDTYEHLLDIINHQEAIMVYHYMDECNKVNLVEFIDVTNNEQIISKINEDDRKIITTVNDQTKSTNFEKNYDQEKCKHKDFISSFTKLEDIDESNMNDTSHSNEKQNVISKSDKNIDNVEEENNNLLPTEKKSHKESLMPDITQVMVN